MKRLIDAIKAGGCTAALTGAGISTLCGIPDFRGPKGIYTRSDAERIFDIDWFDRDPSIYYGACRDLIYGLKDVKPGPVHIVLKHLEDMGLLAGIATQNIDMLHQRAGSHNVWEVHGSPLLHRCRLCSREATYDEICKMLEGRDDAFVPRCPVCGGAFKPDITFFGESLPEVAFREATALAIKADVMIVLGTSLTVYPAAGLPCLTLQRGGKVFIVNAQPTPLDDYAVARYPDLVEFADAVFNMNMA